MAKAKDSVEKALDQATPQDHILRISQREKLDEQAFCRACSESQKSSLLVHLDNDKDIRKAARDMRGFDHRVIALINRWSRSDHPEEEVDRVLIGGEPMSKYMKENGYSFMDCMMLAQTAIEKNRPGVEFKDVELSAEQKLHDKKMNLSDPSIHNVPPSHMPKGLNSILKVLTVGLFQNREERMNNKREKEMIRQAAIEKERQSRLDKRDKSEYAEEVQRKKEENRKAAEKNEKFQEEKRQREQDTEHSKEGLKGLETYRQKADRKLTQLAARKEKLTTQAEANKKKLAEMARVKETTKEWLEANPDWKKDPDKRKAFAGMQDKVKTYNELRKEHEQLGRDLAKVDRAAGKMRDFVGEMEGKRPRLTQLYQKQAGHSLTEEERKELAALEKPGALQGKTRKLEAKPPAKEALRTKQKENPAKASEKPEKEVQEKAAGEAQKKRQQEAREAGRKGAGKPGPGGKAPEKAAPGKKTPERQQSPKRPPDKGAPARRR